MTSLFYAYVRCVALALVLVAPPLALRADDVAPASITVAPPAVRSASLRVLPRVEHTIPDLLFGGFMERASWGEPGYLSATLPDNPRKLRPEAVEMIRALRLPVIRFPGGTDLDRIDWTDLIDNGPAFQGKRPLFKGRMEPALSNEFGYDEFFAFCREVGAEPLLPLAFEPAFARKTDLHQAALHWAGLVAYCNLPVGAPLPEGMPDWPAIRAKNGHPAPYRVKYFQIGNEVWAYTARIFKQLGLAERPIEERVDWYLDCLEAFSRAIRSVDPTVTIIADGPVTTERAFQEAVFASPRFRAAIDQTSIHVYSAWGVKAVQDAQGKGVPFDQVSAEDLWKMLVAVPSISPSGESVLGVNERQPWDLAQKAGLPVAVTEWNNITWWTVPKDQPQPALDSHWARAVGAAGMFHAILRGADRISLANFSMLIGSGWDIHSIRVSPEWSFAPHFTPYGAIFAQYARHRGDRLLAVEASDVPTFAQNLKIRGTVPHPAVRAVDALATRDAEHLYLHLIQRDFSSPVAVTIDLSAFPAVANATPVLTTLSAPIEERKGPERFLGFVGEQTTSVPIQAGRAELLLPARSVSVLRVPLAPVSSTQAALRGRE